MGTHEETSYEICECRHDWHMKICTDCKIEDINDICSSSFLNGAGVKLSDTLEPRYLDSQKEWKPAIQFDYCTMCDTRIFFITLEMIEYHEKDDVLKGIFAYCFLDKNNIVTMVDKIEDFTGTESEIKEFYSLWEQF